jgi:signal transduction histidine kinase
MPEIIRRTKAGRPTQSYSGFGILAGVAVLADDTAHAEGAITVGQDLVETLASVESHEIAALALILSVILFAVLTSIMLVRTRTRAAEFGAAAHDEIATLEADVERLSGLLMAEPQVLVVWEAAADAPEIVGDPSIIAPGLEPESVLAFETWLSPDKAVALDQVIAHLHTHGEGFALSLVTPLGRLIESEGRAVGGRVVVKFREVAGVRRELTELNARYQRLQNEVDSLRFLAEAVPSPVWVRDAARKFVFVNSAYARSVEAVDAASMLTTPVELFDIEVREDIDRTLAAGHAYIGRVHAATADRVAFDVFEVPTPRGSAGISIDVSETEELQAELARMLEAHRRTLDQLATSVAIFGADRRLAFYNAAYRALWDLDPAFLDQKPSDSAILDRLRAARRLPEQQDFRRWKTELHNAYTETDTKRHEWHLPDNRTLRVVTTPNPEGGVTYLFDDITERLELERRFDALIRVQGETLDNLAEGVAVFGSDGRLRLFNPAFARLWRIAPATLAERPHVETVIGQCRPLSEDETTWRALRIAVTALDKRDPISGRIERSDGTVVDYATMPLPDGATLLTFQDVSDSVNVERALRERNEALEAADQLKLNFVRHVSYELRSPLTNIIGFAHFLGDPGTGPLNPKQAEYLGYITVSTNALLALINNILDLATIDAGAMSLNIGPVDIRKTMESAAEGVQDRLVKGGITLDIRAADDVGSFLADERRVRQILFNLLSNAIGFSPPGERVILAALRRKDSIIFSVTDNGPGIPPEMKDKVFDWFETHTLGSRHRGLGLGLTIVRSFVELHGGTVRIHSEVGQGTTVICTFPVAAAVTLTAAE